MFKSYEGIPEFSPSLRTAANLASAAISFPLHAYNKFWDTATLAAGSFIPQRVYRAVDKMLGIPQSHFLKLNKRGMLERYPRYDGYSGYMPNIYEPPSYDELGRRQWPQLKFIDHHDRVNYNRNTFRYDVTRIQDPITDRPASSMIPPQAYQFANAATNAKILFDRAFYHKDSLFNRLGAGLDSLRGKGVNPRKANMFNRKVKWQFKPGYITKGMRKSLLKLQLKRTKNKKFTRRKRAKYMSL